MQQWIEQIRGACEVLLSNGEREAPLGGRGVGGVGSSQNASSTSEDGAGDGNGALGAVERRTNSDGSTIVMGWMLKKGAVRKHFQRRFFRATRDALSYFRNEDDMIATGTIDLGAVVSLHNSHESNFAMELETPCRAWVLCPETEQSLVEWARVLSEFAGVPMPAVTVQDFEAEGRSAIGRARWVAYFKVGVPRRWCTCLDMRFSISSTAGLRIAEHARTYDLR